MAKDIGNDPIDDNLPINLPDTRIDRLALKEMNERYHLLMKLAGDGIIIVQNGQIKESSPCIAKLCGYSLEEMLNNSLAGYLQSEDVPAVESIVDSSPIGSNVAQMLETTLVCKNDRRLKVEITAADCTFRQKPAKLIVVRDLSNRLTAKESLEKAGKLDAIAALSGGIAHDYNCYNRGQCHRTGRQWHPISRIFQDSLWP